MKSSGTGSMILSMYRPIHEGQNCVGYVGAGVYASHLMDTLLNIVTTDEGYLEIMQLVGEGENLHASTYSYRDEDGPNQLVVYKYLKDRGWIFMVREDAASVYHPVVTVRLVVGAVCAAVAFGIILVFLLILRREGRELMVVERAVATGKGFSVVAEEVRNLAAKSSQTAQNTNNLINHSVKNVKAGTKSTDLAVSAMRVIGQCVQSIKTLMGEIAAASVQQSEMIVLVENGIKKISAVVQANSNAAEKSALVSTELSEQARTLNSLISRFRMNH